MFGSLVIIFPTPHEGGALVLRHRGHEWTFDSGRELAAVRELPMIGYVAFFSDVEHEVVPIISGHRVTLTYNLYFDDAEGTVSSSKAAPEHPSLPPVPNENVFRETFQALLENPEFLPDGGTLAFGMRHVYPITHRGRYPTSLNLIYGALKGSDAVVYQTARALGFQPVLYMHYKSVEYRDHIAGVVIDKVLNSSDRGFYKDMNATSVIVDEGGIEVYHECGDGSDEDGDEDGDEPNLYAGEYDYKNSDEKVERVEWVTPVKRFNRHLSALGMYGNAPSLDMAYADLCMFVRIGKAGERALYSSVSQRNKEWDRVRHERRFQW